MIITARWWRRDDGRVSVFFAIAFMAAIVLIGLSVDGGGRFQAMARADNIAAEAARAAGQAIDGPQAITGGQKVVDPTRAAAAVQTYLTAAGVTGTVTISEDRRRLDVTVTIVYQHKMLSVIGSSSSTVTGRATAVLLTG